ncbi:MAG: PQQ-binding-like beta-propeller repeat protein [Fimbriimonadaceae bacterium]|nr:PQQ-binding-like beta-propeller repeat protein [Fimbriimonadaceae bacterium]
MEAQLGLLAAILEQRSEEQAAAYAAFRRAVDLRLAAGQLVARHGVEHWKTIGLLANRMVPEKVFGQMAAAELFTLATAAVAHDLALPDREGYQWLTEQAEQLALDAAAAATARLVCEFVSTCGRRLRRMPRWGYIGREAVDLRRAGAILLVSNQIDLEHCDLPVPEEAADVDREKPASWPQQLGLSVGLIDPREGVLRLDLTSPSKSWRRIIEEHFKPPAAEAMEVSRNILLASGMPFRELELHDLHAKPSADVARAQEVMRARAGARRRPERPFKPLDPFGEDEPHLLAARDDDVIRLAGRCLTSPLTLLTGETGVGKTSLVAAGVIPWLREHEYDGIYARCLNDPTESLLEAVRRRLGETERGEARGAEALVAAVQELASRVTTPVVLVLDQAQELFTRLGSRTRLEFAKDLAGVLSLPGEPVHVLLVVQREFFVNLVELLPLLPTLYHEVVELRRLTTDQAQTAIRRALGRFRLRFDGLVQDHLIEDLATAEGVLPVELQICCDYLTAQVEEDEYYIGYDVYRRNGPARKILDGLIDSKLRSLRWRRHAQAKSLLVNCVTAQRTKALLSAEECAVDLGCDLATATELLDELITLGLLRRQRVGARTFFELRHEYLAQRLEPWIGDVEREAKDVDDLLHRELNNYEKFQLLLDREKLRLIHQYRRRLTLTPEELELVIRSAAQERSEIDYWFGRVNELSVSQQMVLAVDLLYSPEPDLRDALRAMIPKLDHQAVLPTLLDSLREADLPVRETAIEVLREIDTNLVKALETGDAATQQQAAYALGQIGAQHAVTALVETAQHAPAEVREQAVEALSQIDRSRSAELLIRSLRSGSRRSRWNAAVALGRLGRDQSIRDRIIKEADRAEAPDALLFAAARASLEGRHFEDADRWLQDLDRRPVPEDQKERVERAWQELQQLRKQQERGLFTWPMYRGSPGGSAYTPQRLALPLSLKWEFATKDCVYSSPAVANGSVFIGSTDKQLYGLDVDSGAERWTYDAEAELHASPCVLDGRIFIGALDGQMHCVEQETGRPVWRQRLGESLASSVRGLGPRLFVGTTDGSLVAFAPDDGQVLWRTTLPGRVDASPATDGEWVAAGTSEAGLVLLRADSGEVVWQWQVAGGLRGSPLLADGHLVVSGADGRLELLDLGGTLVWTAFLGAAVNSSPALAHGRIYCGAADGEIAAIDLATGRRAWTFEAEGDVSASPTVAGNTVFVGTHGGHLYALKADDGELLWRYRTGYSIHSTPAVADGRLFVALRYYNMCAFAEPVEVEELRR